MKDLSRRDLLVAGAAAGAMAALHLQPARADDAPRPALPIPPELRANAQGIIAFGAGAGTAGFLPVSRRRPMATTVRSWGRRCACGAGSP
jgi:blue copper oxidase